MRTTTPEATTELVHHVLFHPDALLQLSFNINTNLGLRATCRDARLLADEVLKRHLAERAAERKLSEVEIREVWATRELTTHHHRTLEQAILEPHVDRVVLRLLRDGVTQKKPPRTMRARGRIYETFCHDLDAAVTLSNVLRWMPQMHPPPPAEQTERDMATLIKAFYAASDRARRQIGVKGNDESEKCRMYTLYEMVGFRPVHAPTCYALLERLADMVENLAREKGRMDQQKRAGMAEMAGVVACV